MFAFSYLDMYALRYNAVHYIFKPALHYMLPTDSLHHKPAILHILCDHAILAPPLPSPLTYRYG